MDPPVLLWLRCWDGEEVKRGSAGREGGSCTSNWSNTEWGAGLFPSAGIFQSKVSSPFYELCTLRQSLRRKVQGQKAWTGNTQSDQGPEKGLAFLLLCQVCGFSCQVQGQEFPMGFP